MAERNLVEVNEKSLMRMIAGEEPILSEQEAQKADVNTPEVKTQKAPEVETQKVEENTPEAESQKVEDGDIPETGNDVSVNEGVITPVKGKKKNSRQTDFEATFLKEAKITDRRQLYISGVFYDKISAYLRTISEGKVSMVGYIHNVLAHHMLEFKDEINTLYQSKINKSNPL